jgi:transposase-like protein
MLAAADVPSFVEWLASFAPVHFADAVANGKHQIGRDERSRENEIACKAMLENLVSRGLKPNRSRLFIIDGSKDLRSAIRSLFGRRTPVQRCQIHKVRNVLGHLPDERHADVRAAMREA